MSKLELAKEKIKEFYPKILVRVVDIFYDDEDSKFDENEIISNKFIGEYAANSFEVNYGENKDIVNIVADTEDIISLNALMMFMCIDANYALSPLNNDIYYISRFSVSLYLGQIYQKTSNGSEFSTLQDCLLKHLKEDNIDE